MQALITFLKKVYKLLKSLKFPGNWEILILWKTEQVFHIETHLTYAKKRSHISGC